MRKSIEYIIYQIILAVICYNFYMEHNYCISGFTSPAFQALFWETSSGGFTTLESILGIILSIAGLFLMGFMIVLGCNIVCCIPLLIFSYVFEYENEEVRESSDRVLRWSIIAAVIVVVFSLVTFSPDSLDESDEQISEYRYTLQLVAENPSVKTLVYVGNEINDIAVEGIAVGYLHKIQE